MVVFVPDDAVPLVEARSFSSYIGGAESNVAVGLAALGTHVRWAGVLGDDPLGRRIARELSDAGVDVSVVGWSEAAHTGLYLKDPGGQSTAVYYYRRDSAAATIDETIWSNSSLRTAAILHLTGVTAALSESARAAVRAAVVDRCSGAALVSFDVNHRPSLWPREDAGAELALLANAADLVFVGLDEAGALWGCRTVEDVRRRLPDAGTVVVKDGARGASACTGETEVFVPSLPVRVVEPVGAGDAFAAGFLRALLEGLDTRSCLRYGHLLAASALSVRGDTAPPPDQAAILRALVLSDDDWSRQDVHIHTKEQR